MLVVNVLSLYFLQSKGGCGLYLFSSGQRALWGDNRHLNLTLFPSAQRRGLKPFLCTNNDGRYRQLDFLIIFIFYNGVCVFKMLWSTRLVLDV